MMLTVKLFTFIILNDLFKLLFVFCNIHYENYVDKLHWDSEGLQTVRLSVSSISVGS